MVEFTNEEKQELIEIIDVSVATVLRNYAAWCHTVGYNSECSVLHDKMAQRMVSKSVKEYDLLHTIKTKITEGEGDTNATG